MNWYKLKVAREVHSKNVSTFNELSSINDVMIGGGVMIGLKICLPALGAKKVQTGEGWGLNGQFLMTSFTDGPSRTESNGNLLDRVSSHSVAARVVSKR